MSGWILDYRQELTSDVWSMPPMYHRIWQYLKYKVNHTPSKIPNKDGTFTTVKQGQHATSYRIIAEGVSYYDGLKRKVPNPKTIKTVLTWLEKNNMITVRGNSKGTMITVIQWDKYQKDIVRGNAKVTQKKHDLDTNKECTKEELKNDKENTKAPDLLEGFSEDFKDTFKEFKKMRIKMKAPMTDHAVGLLLSKLKRMTTDEQNQIKLLNISIENGWKSVYETKGMKAKSEEVDWRTR